MEVQTQKGLSPQTTNKIKQYRKPIADDGGHSSSGDAAWHQNGCILLHKPKAEFTRSEDMGNLAAEHKPGIGHQHTE